MLFLGALQVGGVDGITKPDSYISRANEGEVIFKKYSPIGEMNTFAAQYADTLARTCSLSVLICDRDAVIAVGGVSKKEYMDKSLSQALEDTMQ